MSCGLAEFNTQAFPGVFPHAHLVHRLCSVCFLICTQYTGFDRCVSSALSTQAFDSPRKYLVVCTSKLIQKNGTGILTI